MKIKSLFLVMAIALLAMQFGCSSESLGSDNGPGSTCPAVGDLTVEFRNGGIGSSEFCSIGGELTQSATLSTPADGVDWFLDGDITVSAGTLTISPGVEVFAEGAEEYIYVQNGAAISALGTENSPIVFSSNDDGEDGGNEWGGIIIESLLSGAATHRLAYVVVAEAGLPVTLGGETYSANINFVGEHEDTIVQFLQSHASGDDGLVMLSEGDESMVLFEDIVVTAAANDSIYFDNFSGLLKNVLSIQSGLDSDGAGIRGGGVDSNPLIINTTFIGGDVDPQNGGAKFGFIFEDDFEMPRIANTAIVNFRSGCYSVLSPTNLSALDTDPIPDPSLPDSPFIDGVHCVNEFMDLSGINSAPFNGIFLPDDLVNFGVSGSGLSFYENTNALFEDEASGATETAAYYLTQIGGLVNGTSDLQRYNDGDANLDGNTDADDEAVSPLFGINSGLFRGLFQPEVDGFGCDALSQLPSGAEFRDADGIAIIPQPDPNDFVCGFLFVPAQFGAFNITVIGAVESSTDTRFDDWTIDGSL